MLYSSHASPATQQAYDTFGAPPAKNSSANVPLGAEDSVLFTVETRLFVLVWYVLLLYHYFIFVESKFDSKYTWRFIIFEESRLQLS